MLAIRVPFAVIGGALFSVAIFLGLWRLVSAPFTAEPLAEARIIVFTPQRVDTPVETKRQEKPVRKPPPVVVVDPRGPRVIGDPIDPLPKEPTGVIRPPRTGLPVGVDRDAVPLVRINPDYPPRALSGGIHGWAQVRFAVTAAGTVRDAVVVASEPGEIFDEAALEAVARWRYNPRVENGVAVERVGLETVFRFELEN
jgi:protein TonB